MEWDEVESVGVPKRGSADAGEAAPFARRQRSLQRLSLKASRVNVAVSAALAANA